MFFEIKIAVFAFVFCELLITEGNILGFYGQLIKRLPEWAAMPLGLCAKCFAGQVAFWSYFFTCLQYNVLQHLFAVVFTIFFTELIVVIYGKIQV
ncbi:MAG TPA: hypothetical protein DEQ09_08945 [Bacteroidales bacterium]|nr:hypothetical protein [Bacteroidales bacterium]